MNYDKIENIDGGVIQHGKYNDRVYLMKLGQNGKQALQEVEDLAKDHKYGKIFAKVEAVNANTFLEKDFILEAKVPNLYRGKEDGLFYSKFLKEKRKIPQNEIIQKNIQTALKYQQETSAPQLNSQIEELTKKDAKAITKIYKQVFQTYPFPIFDDEYIKECIETNVRFFAIKENENIVAIASSEIDFKNQNVEMTDFATLPEHRGKGYAHSLLALMETEMKKAGIKTAYTIARSHSCGMNITFSRLGYQLAGTLINNTNIYGEIESMNVWYKSL